MAHVRFSLSVVRLLRSPCALAPPGGRLVGLVLASAGIVLLGLASAPLLAGAQADPVCNTQGTNSPCTFMPEAEQGVPLASLKTVTKPDDPQLADGGRFVRNQTALIALGKAFFWDQQVGSDGQACASCHFSAGADPRVNNQVSPGLKAQPTADTTFQIGGGPNHQLAVSDFPIHKLAPDGQTVVRDSNDVVSSAGVFFRTFSAIQQNGLGLTAPSEPFDTRAMDSCVSTTDPQNFSVSHVNVRRVEPRNTPTMINAMFYNRNFWDSRAQDVFNGVTPFGVRDSVRANGARVYEDSGGPFSLATPVTVGLAFSSLASQAVGPPLSEFEMSCLNRTFPDLGHKLLTSTNTPLAEQNVSANDSVLGNISNAQAGNGPKGLAQSYPEMIVRAFQPGWWESLRPVSTATSGTRPQIEANFSLFWGLAVQAYMETLRADDTPVDRFLDGSRGALTDSQKHGLLIFESAQGTAPDPRNPSKRIAVNLSTGAAADARCTACHGGPEMTAASIDAVTNDARLERMGMANQGCAIYDAGHFNTGVRPSTDDLSLGASDPFANPLGETALVKLGILTTLVPASVAPFGLVPAFGGTDNCDGLNVNGTFKAPQLRNVELTGPYFHNGGQISLRQVVDFYNRGSDFTNLGEFDPNIHALNLGDQDKTDLVAFLLALTDERVAFERAPFDHPSLCVANGESGSDTLVAIGPPLPGGGSAARAADNIMCVDAVGARGRATRLKPFMNVNQSSP
jgi:cytochrome c peroxidase